MADTFLSFQDDPDVKRMLAVKAGDQRAFEDIMRVYFPRVLNFIYRFTNDREEAEDLTQDVFVKVYNSAASYQPQSKLQTWIFTIAKHESLNALRRRKYKTVSLDQPVEGADSMMTLQVADDKAERPDEGALKDERVEHVRAALEELPEQQRMAVLLRRYEQMSYEDIAKAMNTTEKAVKSLLNRAKEKLKIALAPYVANKEAED